MVSLQATYERIISHESEPQQQVAEREEKGAADGCRLLTTDDALLPPTSPPRLRSRRRQ